MPRPSLKIERTEQIFTAFERCVARYGIDGASLEKVADEAKLQRSMIRHFVGNRDVLVEGLAERLTTYYTQSTLTMVAQLPEENPANMLIEWCFDPQYASDSDKVLALEALIACAPRFPLVNKRLQEWYADVINQFKHVVSKQYPNTNQQDCYDVAVGLIGIYFNTDAMEPLALDNDKRERGKRAALRLLQTLETHGETK